LGIEAPADISIQREEIASAAVDGAHERSLAAAAC
jgi:sRNA-binding carbon storage regulator CsrA